jgi:hypothetical protein
MRFSDILNNSLNESTPIDFSSHLFNKYTTSRNDGTETFNLVGTNPYIASTDPAVQALLRGRKVGKNTIDQMVRAWALRGNSDQRIHWKLSKLSPDIYNSMETMPTTVNWRFEDDWEPDTDISNATLYGLEDPDEELSVEDGRIVVAPPKKWWE